MLPKAIEEEVVEEETEEIIEEEEEKKEIVNETIEEKVARLEAERIGWEKKEEEYKRKEKRMLDSKAEDGRRYKLAEEKQVEFDRQLRELQSQINTAGGRREVQEEIDNIDTSDPKEVYNLIEKVSAKVAEQKIKDTLYQDTENQRKYSTGYEKKVDELGRDLDPETYQAIREKLALMTSSEYCRTGNGEIDAITNFQQARADYYEEISRKGRKLPNLKKDSTAGTGVGGKGTVSTARKKSVSLDTESAKLLKSLGRSDEWASKVLTAK